GHGLTKEEFAAAGYRDYIDQAEEAFVMMPLLGDRVIVIGSSMGGLLGTYLAAQYPGKIAGLILASPFYDFAPAPAKLFYYPGGTSLVELLQGKVRRPTGGPTDVPGWEGYWTKDKYYSSFKSAADMVKYTARDAAYRKVTDPVLMLYYYDDEKNQDTTASVAAMKRAFGLFGHDSKPNPLNRAVAIPKSAHVLLSKWVISDRATVEKEIDEFLRLIEK
ncbi:MAG TPA: alpha/beta fold hydrolase, partial [Spirochaetes bacterium]|nr:alpha/beta fold hydrolase [Spirochaetota bacterium]